MPASQKILSWLQAARKFHLSCLPARKSYLSYRPPKPSVYQRFCILGEPNAPVNRLRWDTPDNRQQIVTVKSTPSHQQPPWYGDLTMTITLHESLHNKDITVRPLNIIQERPGGRQPVAFCCNDGFVFP